MTLAVIPARIGSERIPHKNLRTIGGVTLLNRAIQFSQEMGFTTVVSTDSNRIADVAKGAGVWFKMSSLHTGCYQGALAVWQEVWDMFPGEEISVLLEPTSPMRTQEDVLRCIEKAPAATVQRVKTTMGPHLQWNGACYAARGEVPNKDQFLPLLTSYRVNIDTWTDLEIARCLIQ